MNRAILHLFLVIAVLFAALVVSTSRWTVFQRDSLNANALNKRQLLEDQRVPRGIIRADDGTVLARSVKGAGDRYSRRYPVGDVFSQTVGYSFPLSVGHSGLEQEYETELTGRNDGVSSIVDQLSGRQRVGREVRTTLDVKAQKVALQALGGRNGAVVAVDPSTGAIKVMASTPTFDPNALRDPSRTGVLKNGSAVNRAVAGQYPPGSTFKVVTAAAAIDSGRYTKDSMVNGKSPQVISGTPLSNFNNEQFGTIPLTTALTHSVNTVWAQVGVKVGRATMQDYMNRFGFYKRAPVDLPAAERTRSGVLVAGHRRFTKVTSNAVDLGRVAIGQGGLLATPLQMLNVASAVANGGRLMRPHIADRIVDRDGRTVRRIGPEVESQVMKPSTAQQLGDMMADVVREGTGTAAALQGISVAGKTGTAERDIQRGINTPWFIGFAPRQNPKVAVAAVIEQAQGQGGVVAAPIAKQVMEALLH